MIDIEITANIATIKPSGALSEDDFAKVSKVVDSYIDEHGAAPNLLLAIEHVPHWDGLAGLLAHARFVRDHHELVKKVAAVGDNMALSFLPSLVDHFVSAKIRHFSQDRIDQARQWLKDADDHPGGFELIEGFASDVIAFKVKGIITSQDYRDVLTPLVEQRLKQHDKLKVLCIVDEDFETYTAGAMWDDARLGFLHYSDFSKIALVTDIGWLRKAATFFAPLTSAQVHVFESSDREAAEKWLA